MILITACGFHLRGHVAIPDHVKTIYIDPENPYDPTQRELRQALRLSGITVTDNPQDVYTLRLLREDYSSEPLVIGTDGITKQEQMNLSLQYQIIPPAGEVPEPQTASTQRTLNVNENQVLGQNQEERIILREMRADLANQLLRRLSAVPAP